MMKVAVIGGGIRGCMAAEAAQKAGCEAALLEVRQTLGHEITAAGQEWLQNGNAEISVQLGAVAKMLLANQTALGNKVLLNSRAGGLLMAKDRAAGVLTANAYGTQLLSADLVIDTEGTLFSEYAPQQAVYSYVFAVDQVAPMFYAAEKMPEDFGLLGNQVFLHAGMLPDRVLVELRYEKPLSPLAPFNPQQEAPAAMRLAEKVFAYLKEHCDAFRDAGLKGFMHNEVRLLHAEPALAKEIPGYAILKAALPDPLSVFELKKMEEEIGTEVAALCKAAEEAEQADSILLRSGKIALDQCTLFDDPAVSFRDGFKLQAVKLPMEKIPCREETEVLVAGSGTAGAQVLEALCRKEVASALVELCALTGGTRTLGMVMGYWHGYKGGRNAYRDAMERELRAVYSANDNTGAMIAENHLLSPMEQHCYMLTPVCGVEMEGKTAKSLLCCDGAGLFRIGAQVIVDATGDGVAAYLAGARYEYGDPRDGSVQTCSTWGIDNWKQESFLDARFHGDHDMLDIDSYEDFLRSVYLGQHDNSNLRYAPLLTVRESRRVLGDYVLTMDDVWDETIFEDTLSVTQTPFDTHGKPSTAFFDMRMGRPKELRARIPYRSYIVKDLSNMLITAKAYSGTRDANGIGRMNADLRHGGYGVGLAAAQAVKEQKPLREIDIKKVQTQLLEEECLPAWTFEPLEWENAKTLYEKAGEGDTQALLYLYRTQTEADLSFIREKWEKESDAPLALCLAAWHELPGALDAAADRLSILMGDTENGKIKEYNFALQLMACLSHGETVSPQKLLPLMEKAQAGGDVYYPADTKYYQKIYGYTRVDTWKVPHYHLLFHLAMAVERHADEMLAAPMADVLRRQYLGGYALIDGKAPQSPFMCHGVSPVMCALLEVRLAAAAARCGSEEGKALLEQYAREDRSVLRKFARKELTALSACEGKVCPVKEKICVN